jgi:hypothetical protein
LIDHGGDLLAEGTVGHRGLYRKDTLAEADTQGLPRGNDKEKDDVRGARHPNRGSGMNVQ